MYLLCLSMFHSQSGTVQGNHEVQGYCGTWCLYTVSLYPELLPVQRNDSVLLFWTHMQRRYWSIRLGADQMFGQFCFYLTVVPVFLRVNSFVVMLFLITFLAMLVCKHASFFYKYSQLPDDVSRWLWWFINVSSCTIIRFTLLIVIKMFLQLLEWLLWHLLQTIMFPLRLIVVTY